MFYHERLMLLQEITLCVKRFLSYVKKQCECTHMENISVLREVKIIMVTEQLELLEDYLSSRFLGQKTTSSLLKNHI